MSRLPILTLLVSSTAVAADVNNDGCVDASFNANTACVAPSADLGIGVIVGAGAVISERASVGANSEIGANAVVGRSATIGARTVLGVDSIIGRAATVGSDVDASAGGLYVGYGASLGDRCLVLSNVTLGNLVSVGADCELGTNAVLGRSVTLGIGALLGAGVVLGPDVVAGTALDLRSGVRVRKGATFGNGVLVATGAAIGRDAVVETGVTVGVDANVGARTIIQAGATVPQNTWIARNTLFSGAGISEVCSNGSDDDDDGFTDCDDPSCFDATACNPPISQHNTLSFSSTGTAGGCSYQSTHAVRYRNLGNMHWRTCMYEAAKRGAGVQSTYQMAAGSQQGWGGYRSGNQAGWAYRFTGTSSFPTASITSSKACVLVRDPRSPPGVTPLSSTRVFDGDTWVYQDYGLKYFDECQLLASNAGASIIPGITIGLPAPNYHINTNNGCNVYYRTGTFGASQEPHTASSGARSGQRLCMVGYISIPRP